MVHVRLLILVSFVLVLACDDDPPPPEEAAALGSRIELAAGDVWLVQKDAKKRLITGAMLPEKATLNVGAGGRSLVRLGTGAGAFLRGSTNVTIDGNSLEMKQGELWADVPAGEREMGRFTVGGVSVTAADAGLDIAVKGGEVIVYVARGLAVVAAPGGRTEVQSGERVVVKGKAKPVVEPVDFWEDWTGGMADRALLAGIAGKGAGRIYGIDRARPGSRPEELQILSQSVRIIIRDGIAHTVVDQRFFNPSSAPLEGWYWFTVPEGASVSRFALEVNGSLVDGEMVERKQAAAAYEEAVRKAFDPALLEWVDGRTFRARIFPIPETGERRVVLSYFELLPLADGVYRYVYPLATSDDTAIQEFSLNVDLGDEGEEYSVRTLQDARVEKDGSSISMRRSGFRPRADFLLELEPREELESMRAIRFEAGEEEADYVMLRYAPAVAWETLDKVPGDVVVVLDTSAGGDESDRSVRSDAVEAILRALSAGDRFAVVATDLVPRVVYPAKGLAKADEKNVSAAVEKLAEVGSAGATDLGEMFSAALDLLHDAEQPAVVYVGDGRATVGETSSLELADRLRRAMGDSRARLFTIAVGDDANLPLLERLARVGGGRSFSINTAEQTVQEALRFVGMVKTPTITDLEINAGNGLDQVFVTAAGKISEGDEVALLARTHHALPERIKITGRLGGKTFEESYETDVEKGAEFGYIPILWARQYLTRLMGDGLEKNRGRIIALGLAYALMTPFTSFLVLESDAAYRQQGIPRRNRHRFSMNIDEDRNSAEVASARNALSIPFSLFGCTRLEDSEEKALEAQASQEKIKEILKHASVERGAGEAPPASAPAPIVAAKPRKMKKKGRLSDEPLGSINDLLGGSVAGKSEDRSELKRPASKSSSSRLGTAGPKERNERDDSGVFRTTNPYKRDGKDQLFEKGVCSDASRRPLAQRRILWNQRLARVTSSSQYARIFFEAGKRCELSLWRDRRVLLDLIESRASSPEAVRGLLSVFAGNRRIQSYLRHRIIKRTLDPNVTMGLQFPDVVNWHAVLAGLAALKTPEARIAELRRILAKNPTDPIGRGQLVQLLVELKMNDEALAEATRLRRDGLASPAVLQILCDLQAEAGRIEAARRTCSELVEFNAKDPSARQRLGDLFLRHGWYDAAYRQYASLCNMVKESASSLLRLAAAAAGMGKVDEALRIERKVASGDGEPGPDDPRRFARLHSAARLSKMLLEARKDKKESIIRALERSLKRTQVFTAQSTIVLLTWEDYDAILTLEAKREDEAVPVSESVLSPQTGLVMIDLGRTQMEELKLIVDTPNKTLLRSVPYTLLTISWDGKSFKIVQKAEKVTIEEA
ncbi:MAG: VWA domain-containing protein [Deltaproteobacteria bacterium]|nr:VWA domain-containing protein [Deltaproteobacteria bacterium]